MQKKKIAVSLLAIAIAILLVMYHWKNPLLLILSLIITGYLKHKLSPVRHEFSMFLITGLLGPLTESLIMLKGAWSYAIPHIFNIPIWLPFLWGVAGMIFVNIYDAFPTKSK